MPETARQSADVTLTPTLRIHRPEHDEARVTRWWINACPVLIYLWNHDEWSALEDRPDDAQYNAATGVWCLVRPDPEAPRPDFEAALMPERTGLHLDVSQRSTLRCLLEA